MPSYSTYRLFDERGDQEEDDEENIGLQYFIATFTQIYSHNIDFHQYMNHESDSPEVHNLPQVHKAIVDYKSIKHK